MLSLTLLTILKTLVGLDGLDGSLGTLCPQEEKTREHLEEMCLEPADLLLDNLLLMTFLTDLLHLLKALLSQTLHLLRIL